MAVSLEITGLQPECYKASNLLVGVKDTSKVTDDDGTQLALGNFAAPQFTKTRQMQF
jgi:hypothetical protein